MEPVDTKYFHATCSTSLDKRNGIVGAKHELTATIYSSSLKLLCDRCHDTSPFANPSCLLPLAYKRDEPS